MNAIRFLFVFLLGLSPALAAPAVIDPAGFSGPVKVACIGDSITQGVGAGAGRSYPAQLQGFLGEKWQVGNFGVSGRTLLRQGDFPYWKEAALQKAQDFRPDVVIIMLGTNDTKPQNWAHRDDFAKDYTDLVNLFLGLPSKPRVFVCRPVPVPAPGNFGINEAALQEEIPVIDRLAGELKLGLIDMHAALDGKPQMLPDRVHPNDDGAKEMAKAAFRVLTGREPVEPLHLNSLFRDHAVLPRAIPLPVWGTAEDGQSVTVEFAGQKASTTAKGGQWEVTLKPLAASTTPASLTVKCNQTLTVTDLLVGDVWLASGQSNMERQLGPRPPQPEIIGWKEAAAAANFPLIREYAVPHKTSTTLQTDAGGQWTVATPATAANFSAVGFYFARSLQPAIKVPVGIIHSSWGGTVAEAWTSEAKLATLGDVPDRNGKNQNAPSRLYNAMIAPLVRFPVKGVIWYQGESNNGRAAKYRALFSAMIADWRSAWKQPDMPFLFVQIAPYKDMTPELREAQLLTAKSVPHTALVVITDAGDPTNIHPANKQPVGERLALAARSVAYGEKIEASGPMFREMRVQGREAWLAFDHAGSGLVAKDGPLKGFAIAGTEKNFLPAQAEIRGDKVVVSSPEVATPATVRFGWANVPDVNLFNREGLPASPFRTDAE